ncbi:MAG: lipoprotein [Rhodobacteraceae bacterium]|nr:lipoprotein [Paracoccaceae bacterium]
MKRTFILLVLTATIAGCNTIPGVGEDVAGGARPIQGWFGG